MLNAEKYARNVSLLCPTCGQSQFEFDAENLQDDSIVKCTSCQLTFTKAQLVEANSENISGHVTEIGKELTHDLRKEFRKAFSGNKFIKMR